MVDRAQLLPVAHRARRDVRRLRVSRLLDRHRHAGQIHAGAPRHHGRPLHGAARLSGRDGPRWSRPRRGSRTARSSKGPCFIDEGAVVKAGARIGPYSVVGRQCHIEEHAVVERAIVWANTPDQPGSDRAGDRSSAAIATSAATRARRGRRRPRRQVGRHGLQPVNSSSACPLNPTRHLQGLRRPRRLSGRDQRRAARAIGAAFVAYLQAKRIAVGRDMRLSSPALAAAFIDGATSPGRRRRRLRA